MHSARVHCRSDPEFLRLQEVRAGGEKKTCKVIYSDPLSAQEERGSLGETGAKGYRETALVMGKLLAQ